MTWRASLLLVLHFVSLLSSLRQPLRLIGRVTTSSRRSIGGTRVISRTQSLSNLCPDPSIGGQVELDTHADTCVLGSHFVILAYTGRVCDVSPYSPDYESIKNVAIVSGATAWTSQQTSETYILVIHEALWMADTLSHSLVNPNQLRAFGTQVQDNPFLAPLVMEDKDSFVQIPMHLDGTNVVFPTRTPTQEELDTCRHVHLNSQQEWDPTTLNTPTFDISQLSSSPLDTIPVNPPGDGEVYNQDSFARRLVSQCTIIPGRTASEVLTELRGPPNFVTEDRRADVTPQALADRWLIGLEQAKATLKSTTQRFLRSALLPASRRYRADRMYLRPRLQGEWYTDTVFMPVKSKDGNTCGQIYANGAYFATFYPMDSKSKAGDSLRVFCREFGVPEILRHDGAPEMVGKKSEFQRHVRKHNIKTHVSEAGLHNQSPAEGVVREVKRKWYRTMFKKRVPTVFWDYGLRWVSETMSRTHLRTHRIDGGVPLQLVTGDTVDISNYLEFGFYDRVWYRDNVGLAEPLPGRWLGVAENIGSVMTYHILQQNGRVVARSTVWNVTVLELQTERVKDIFDSYDSEIKRRIGEDDFPLGSDKVDPELWADLKAHDEDFRQEFFRIYQDENIPEADQTSGEEPSPGILDSQYIRMELALPRGDDGPSLARVKRRKLDANGVPIGRAHTNPILDTRVFEVEFLDGHIAAMTANAIAENLFAQVDSEGHRLQLLDEFTNYRRSEDAVPNDDAYMTTVSGQRRRKETTKGWELLARWKDGSESWIPLKDVKEAFPIQTAEFAVTNQIQDEPAFAWWVPTILRKRAAIVSKVKSTKYWQRTHKYGIEVPKSVKHARELDQLNGDTLWWDAICEEMANVRVAFEEYEGEGIPPGYKHIRCHFIFDVKLGENFRRKARLVAGGHMTGAPTSITYSSVVSRDSVRICLLLAALNDLNILSCDIQGAYLTAPSREKVVITAGPEFGPELEGKILRVTRALYGLKSAGAAFRSFLAEHLRSMDYRPSYADPDVWMRPAVRPDGREHYEYILTYVDDILCISHEPMQSMILIKNKFKLKGDKIEPPTDYLGAILEPMETDRGSTCWSQSSDKYVAAAVANVETFLRKKGKTLPGKKQCHSPFDSNYRPELDISPELATEGHRYFQELIGVLRWACEISRLDILLEVALLSAYLASPREGHLEAALHVFGYLKHHPKRKIAFDPDHPHIRETRFIQHDWSDFYRDAAEAIPPNAPPPRGLPVSTHCFVDADNAGNTVTRRSQMGILIFVNRAPIVWLSKRTNTVESSTFGSEIVALRNAVDLIESLRYKLRMFGVPIEGPTNVFCDNEAVTKNCSTPESTLKKKHHSINYHRNREAVAAKTIRIAKEDSETNLADVFTKIMPAFKRNGLLDKFMY